MDDALLAVLPDHEGDVPVYESIGFFRIIDLKAHQGGGAIGATHFLIPMLSSKLINEFHAAS
jgi:hypothetical protein